MREFIPGLVSVITPVFNASAFLGKMLDSVVLQNYQSIEMVLVDDCSTDCSAEIIADFAKTHPGIVRYRRQEENMGAGVARNTALEMARGQYVAFLDSDDVWRPGKLDAQIQLMRRMGSPFCYTAIEMIDGSDDVVKSKRSVPLKCDYGMLLKNTLIPTSSVVIDRESLGDFRMSQRRGGQDYATWLSLLRGGSVACGINEAFVGYRVGHDSLSSNKFKSIRQVWEIQTVDEGIGKIKAAFDVACFAVNAAKKHFL